MSLEKTIKHLDRYSTEYIAAGTLVSYVADCDTGLLACGAILGAKVTYDFSKRAYSWGDGAYKKIKSFFVKEEEKVEVETEEKKEESLTSRIKNGLKELGKGTAYLALNITCSAINALNVVSLATSIDLMNTTYNSARNEIIQKAPKQEEELEIHIVCDQKFVKKYGENWKEQVTKDSEIAFEWLRSQGIKPDIVEWNTYYRNATINGRHIASLNEIRHLNRRTAGKIAERVYKSLNLDLINEFNNKVNPKEGLYIVPVETHHYGNVNIPNGNVIFIESKEKSQDSKQSDEEIKKDNCLNWKRAFERAYYPKLSDIAKKKDENNKLQNSKPVFQNKYTRFGLFNHRK